MPDVFSPNKSIRREPVNFLAVHWTGGSFASAVDWCMRDESDVSYNTIIAPDGTDNLIVPYTHAAWANGWAKSPYDMVPFKNANHAAESFALAGGPPVPPTMKAREKLVMLLVERMLAHGWGHLDTWRIVGHDEIAVFPPDSAKAGQLGRKPDPQGKGWLPLEPIRQAVRTILRGGMA